VASCCEHGNEPSDSVKSRGISGLAECFLIKKDCPAWNYRRVGVTLCSV
jgi:hypothetical protein